MAKDRWISAKVDEQTHELLCKLATKRGMHPAKLVAQFVEDALVMGGLNEGAGFDLKLYATAQKANRSRVRQQQLETIAWEVAQNDDTEAFEQLEELCDEAGFDVNEIIASAKEYDTPPILVSRNGTGIDAAMRWLQQKFTERDSWPATEIKELGAKRGFNKSTLSSAKRQLGYASVRCSTHWEWQKLEEEEEEGTLV